MEPLVESAMCSIIDQSQWGNSLGAPGLPGLLASLPEFFLVLSWPLLWSSRSYAANYGQQRGGVKIEHTHTRTCSSTNARGFHCRELSGRPGSAHPDISDSASACREGQQASRMF